MTDGTIVFIVVTLVTITDIGIALYMRGRAAAMDNGDVASDSGSADGLRRTATMLLAFAPLMWLVMTLFSFGIIPSGLDPVQF